MDEKEVLIKVQKVVLEPRMSLKQFAKYCTSSPKAQETVLQKSKYPGSYIPKFHEEARRIICNTFSSNFEEQELYFEEFSRHASRLKNEAISYPVNTDKYKNRYFSALALEAMVKIANIMAPILRAYVLENNLSKRRDAVAIGEVALGSMSDMICYTDSGLTLAGFIKFNFTASALKKEEVTHMIYVLKKFTEDKRHVEIDPKHCILIDVVEAKIYQGINTDNLSTSIQVNCTEIKERWNSIKPPIRKGD